ncbi:MAG TPA: protein kinase [Holophagaceae bacterium]|nr:protein kinase [Holophagaceae bacterium]
MGPETLAHYRILRPLGTGGMGEVFLAEDTRLNRKVALKLLRQDQSEGEAGRKRLLREAQAAAQLDHPNACAIYEVGESELGAYIAMQFIEGESLSELMSHQRLELPVVLDIGIQVADALAEAHARGLVHRDIKPQNIMVTAKGQAKVLDFGLAKRMEAIPVGETHTVLTNPGMVLGTVPYMSPEQVKAEELDGRSDVFSLGAVLFELATGRRPFEAHSGVELMAMILTHDPFNASDPNLPLNPELRRILQKALAKDLPSRYQGARELREDLIRLRALVASGPGAFGPGNDATTIHRARMSGDTAAHARRRGWAVGIGAALFVGCLLGVYAWLRPRHTVDSIAVLPIVNESGDANVDYVSDGLTENLIQQLSHLQGLKVIARSSILRYKGQNADPATVGRELGVRAVLVGRMRTRDGQLLLNLELADAREQSRLWGTQLQRPASDLVAIQDGVARELFQHLGRLDTEQDRKAVDQGRIRAQAESYELYLKGRYHTERYAPEDFQKAVVFFDQAIAKDPSFALAHAGKAYMWWTASGAFFPSKVAMAKVREETEIALKLDPNLAEAWSAQGQARAILDHDFIRAEADLRKAVSLNPGSAVVHQHLGYLLMSLGRQAEARAAFKTCLDLDPFSSFSNTFLGGTYFYDRDFANAERFFRKALTLDPENPIAHFMLGWCQDRMNQPKAAQASLEIAVRSGSPWMLGYQGYREARLGNRAKAEGILKELTARQGQAGLYVSPYHLAMVHLGFRDLPKALQLANQCVDGQDEMTLTLPVDPIWDEYRDDPRVQALLKAAGHRVPSSPSR